MSNGVVKWFSSKKGYGFITMEDGQEVFVHYTSIDGNGFRSLEQGEEVQFEVAQGPKGLQAAKVLRRLRPPTHFPDDLRRDRAGPP
jgi:CspA family cold shock protein